MSSLRSLLAALLVLLPITAQTHAQAQTLIEEPKAVPQTREQIQLSYAPLVREAAPAVVNIYTSKQVRRPVNPLFNDPFFRRFFGDLRPQQQEEQQNSLGSGVIVRPEGLIVTNEHVIQGADEIRVVLSDRREFAAEVVVEDERTDLAVVRIIDQMSEPLPALEFADSDNAEVGDLVLAIGNPFGVGQTVTSGIVSALARTDVGVTDYSFFIQTDAAINPGNSGGALLGLDGKLLGINSAIFSRDGGSLGIGFAIPANMVRTVVLAAEQGGDLRRPWIGASGQPVTPDLMRAIGIDRPAGVMLTRIHPGSPAARAGLEIGDVLLALNNRSVDDPKALRFRVATAVANKPTTIQFWRDGKPMNASITPVFPPFDPPPDTTLLGGQHPLSGISVSNLSPGLADQIGFAGDPEGVIIFEIAARSPARRVGFRPGDVVLSLNGADIQSVKQLAALLREQFTVWDISVRRGDRVINAVFRS
ncbi:MAG TPA: serine protease [Rhodospirillaceae bacterium]|nr:serine protease [Alphaproteobacteria bacterium]OUT41626.1 MAG: serine protease [Micavibrio sp. TMED2]HCI46579.1 serine protease [Rhodospirillaceae bacterium]MAS46809.1 serine protease [Alphaproteobacteria bacterium]MAX94904.1 serine protease [Alphaproteobacteria bacterium]